jgi:hypothetical protein
MSVQAQTKSYNNETISWNHSWIVKSTPAQNLPNVLLIGDSHDERYYPVVTNLLKDKAVVSKITTSLSMGDPTFIPQLTGLLAKHKFDYIFFNNGLHGVLFTPSEYAADISKVYKLLTKNNPAVKIVWANTTARRVPNNLDTFDAYHADVIERNKYVSEFCNKKVRIHYWFYFSNKRFLYIKTIVAYSTCKWTNCIFIFIYINMT